MTPDNIIAMAREANADVTDFINYDFGELVVLFYPDQLERFAALVVEKYKEGCARELDGAIMQMQQQGLGQL